MVSLFLAIPIIASFLVTFIFLPFWIRKARSIGLDWEDMNKLNAPKVAGSGGLGVIFGFITGILIFIAYRVFILNTSQYLIEMFVILSVVLILALLGFIDDLMGWKKGGLSKRSRIIMVLFAAIPLMAINAGKSTISIPFLGGFDVGIIYPLIFVPIGIVGATSTFNFLAGFNGLEAGQGILILSALASISLYAGASWLAIIALCLVASLIAFLIFNISPARVFPGDMLTYTVGGLIAILAILGNFEKVAVFLYIPYAIETILKIRGKLKKQSFGLPQKDGSLKLRYPKIYGLEHLAIAIMLKLGIKATEKRVVYMIWGFQLIIILIAFLIFKDGMPIKYV